MRNNPFGERKFTAAHLLFRIRITKAVNQSPPPYFFYCTMQLGEHPNLHKGACGFSSHSEQHGSAVLADAAVSAFPMVKLARQTSIAVSRNNLRAIELVNIVFIFFSF